MQTERPLTIDDLYTTPADGHCYEIIGGELLVWTSPPTRHQLVAGDLLIELSEHVDSNELGLVVHRLNVRLTEYDIVEPDIIVVLKEHRERIRIERNEGAPDLVIEITSSESRYIDHVRKAALYAAHGVREYWLVDPEGERIVVQTLHAGRFSPVRQYGTKVRSGLPLGFEVDPAKLFDFPAYLDSDPELNG